MEKSIPFAESNLNSEQMNIAAGILRALDHPIRIKILNFLILNDQASVNEIMIEIKQNQSKTSQMLKILKNEAFVSSNRAGKFINYSVNSDKIHQIENLLK